MASAAPEARGARREAQPADLLATTVVVLSFGLAAFAALTGVLTTAQGATEDTEVAVWLISFTVILPLALLAGLWAAGRMEARGLLGAAAAAWATLLLALLCVGRFVYALAGEAVLGTAWFLAALAAWAVAAWVLAGPGAVLLRRIGRLSPGWMYAAPAVLSFALLLGFAPDLVLKPGKLALGLAITAAVAGLYALSLRRRLGGWRGRVLDVLVVILAFATVHDLSLYLLTDTFRLVEGPIHQNFFLAPANEVLHGRTLLVDAVSQYGVVAIYAVAGWSKLTSIGYGSLTLLSGLLTAAQIAVVYGILRLCGASRYLAFATTAACAIALAFSSVYVSPFFPSTGGMRSLVPYLAVMAALAVAIHPERRALRVLLAALIGLASVWSFEALAYAGGPLVAMEAVRALVGRDLRGAVATFARAMLWALAGIVVAQVALALITKAASGQWPDWGWYLAFVNSYSADAFLTFTFQPWSPGVAVCAVYFASLAAVVVVLVRAPEVAIRESRLLVALAGLASFTYFLSLSATHRIPQVGLPAFMCLAVWLTLLERHRAVVPRGIRAALVAVPTWMAVMLVVGVWPYLSEHARYTPLAMAIPDGGSNGSLRNEVGTMRRSVPIGPEVNDAVGLIEREFPGRDRVPTLLESETTVETLMQARRGNTFPVTHWLQDSIILDRSWPRVRRYVDRLRPGTLVLTEPAALRPDPRYKAGVLQKATARLQRRFRLEYVAGNPDGHQVVRLRRR